MVDTVKLKHIRGGVTNNPHLAAMVDREVSWMKYNLKSQPFAKDCLPAFSHQDQCSQLAVYLALLTRSIFLESDFVKLLSTARKSLEYQEIVKKAHRDKVWRERRCEKLSKGKGGETCSMSGGPEAPLCKDLYLQYYCQRGEWQAEDSLRLKGDDQTSSPTIKKDLKFSKKSAS